MPVVFPVHPRTMQAIENLGANIPASVRLVKPQGYLQMIRLISNARVVLTDSGGVQKESYLLGAPALVLRNETEWVEILETGWNKLIGDEPSAKSIMDEVSNVSNLSHAPRPDLFGDGYSGERIASCLRNSFPS